MTNRNRYSKVAKVFMETYTATFIVIVVSLVEVYG